MILYIFESIDLICLISVDIEERDMVFDTDGCVSNILLFEDDKEDGWDGILSDLELQYRGEDEILVLRQNVYVNLKFADEKICKTEIEGVFLFIHLDEIHLALYRHLK